MLHGFLISFAWNELIVPIWGFSPLTNWQGMGLSTFVSIFFLGLAKADVADDDSAFWKRAIIQPVLLFLIVWIVSLSY